MSEDEMKQQLDDAIKEYAGAKDKLKCMEKKLADFRSAAAHATTAASPGGVSRISASDWKSLLNGTEFAALTAEYFDLKDEIERLGEYLRFRGFGGLVS